MSAFGHFPEQSYLGGFAWEGREDSSSGLGRVQCFLCLDLASSWPLEVSGETVKSEGMFILARPSITTNVFTATLAAGCIGAGRWNTLQVFGCEGIIRQ